MKTKTKNTPAVSRWGKAALLASCALLLTSLQASATSPATIGVDLGADGIQTGSTVPPSQFNNTGAFALGINLGNSPAFSLSGSAQVVGDVEAAGNGNVSLAGAPKITGRLSYYDPGVLNRSGSPVITGTIYNNTATNSLLNAGVTAANTASTTANGFAATASLPGNVIDNQNLTLSIAANTQAVYKLTSLTETGVYKLTLSGTATSAVVVDVSGALTLGNSAQITLTGGLTWNHVLFNLTGTASSTLSGASVMSGIILANKSLVTLSGSAAVDGAVIANQIALSGTATITRPPIVSP